MGRALTLKKEKIVLLCSLAPPKAGRASQQNDPDFEKSLTWSGCRELNPVYMHPMHAYYRYTTARRPASFRFMESLDTSGASQNSLAIRQPDFLQIRVLLFFRCWIVFRHCLLVFSCPPRFFTAYFTLSHSLN